MNRARPRRGWVAVAGLAAALASGCASMEAQDRGALLNDALSRYASAMRWGHLNTVNSYLREPDGTPLADDRPFREDIRVTGYRVVGRSPLDEQHVRVEARLEYMSNQTGRIEAVQDSQLWWYDEAARRWFLDGRPPAVLVSP